MRARLGLTSAFTVVSLGLGMAPSVAHALTRLEYAAQCAAEMGKIPSFNCLVNGEVLAITVNGVAQDQQVPVCDKPIQLPILGLDGQCTPYARFVPLSTGNPSVTTIAICRKYRNSDNTLREKDPFFRT